VREVEEELAVTIDPGTAAGGYVSGPGPRSC
jgi:hypothetical protein